MASSFSAALRLPIERSAQLAPLRTRSRSSSAPAASGSRRARTGRRPPACRRRRARPSREAGPLDERARSGRPLDGLRLCARCPAEQVLADLVAEVPRVEVAAQRSNWASSTSAGSSTSWPGCGPRARRSPRGPRPARGPGPAPGPDAQLGDGDAVRVLGRDAVAGHPGQPRRVGERGEPRQHLGGGRHAGARTTGRSARPRMTNSGRRRGSRAELQGRRPVEQRAERRLELHPGQRRADAEVDAGAEGDVRVVGAADVEGVGGREHRRVPVGRAEQRGDLLPRGTVTPPISTSSVAVRSNSCSGESKRMSSSIAVGSSARSVAQPPQLVGVRAAARAGRSR